MDLQGKVGNRGDAISPIQVFDRSVVKRLIFLVDLVFLVGWGGGGQGAIETKYKNTKPAAGTETEKPNGI